MGKKPTYEELVKKIEEMEKIQETLKKSDRKYRFIEKYTQSLAAVIDMEARYLYVSPFYEKIGYNSEDLIGKFAFDYVHPDDTKRLMDELIKAQKGENNSSLVEYRFLKKDGTYIPIQSQFDMERGRIISISMDITERKKSEEELKDRNALLKTILKNSLMGFAINKIDSGEVIYTSDMFLKSYNVSKEDCSNVNDFFKTVYGNRMEEIGQEILDDVMSNDIAKMQWTDVPMNDKNGNITYISAMNIPLDEQNLMISTVIDSTKRKKAEEHIQVLNNKYTSMIANIGDVIGIMGVDGIMKYKSPNIEKWFGWKPEELVGADGWETVHPDDKDWLQREFIVILEKPNAITAVEYKYRCKDGTYKWVHLTATNCLDDPNIEGVLLNYHDITDRKKAEEEKLEAQKVAAEQYKLALVGQVAGKMAHDFNNILGIIMGNTELTLLDCREPDTIKTLELIFEQTIRGKNLTRNLVAFAKDQEPKQEFFRISEKIDLVLNLMRKDLEGIEFRKEESPDVPELLADPGMIEHALVNLLQNSIHATSMNEFPRIIVRTYSLDNKICFEIADNGCGISKEHLNSIYGPSFTLKGSRDVTGSYKSGIKGTGYGMANIKKYVELHRGSISVESELGLGTKFTICLPVIKKELTQEEKVELREEITHCEKYILLVEDEVDISNVQYRILTDEPCNHKVDVANTGKIAMDLFDRNEYDFVSLDYALPGGINGMDVYKHIRKTNQTVPVLFISGNIEFLESIIELKQKDVYVDHLSKPCPHKDYVMAIEKLLKKR